LKAVILVGGVGTRLRPLTYLVPKAMLPIGGRPLLEHTIKYLANYGIKEVVLCVAYLKNRIKEHFKDGKELGVVIECAEADQPLGTAGQLMTAKDLLTDTFLAMNGDIVTSLSLKNLADHHKKSGGIGTIALKKFEVQIPHGYIELDRNMILRSFQEKPTMSYQANAGVYILEPRIFNYVKTTPPVSLEHEVFPTAIASGEKIAGYYEDAYWADVGTISDFERVDKELLSKNLNNV
jgi:NDP-sugar pyrophosphorylase family protein